MTKRLDFISPLDDKENKEVLNAVVEMQTHAIMQAHFNTFMNYLAELHIGLAISSTEATGPKSLQRGGASRVLGEIVDQVTGAIALFHKKREIERTVKVFHKEIKS